MLNYIDSIKLINIDLISFIIKITNLLIYKKENFIVF